MADSFGPGFIANTFATTPKNSIFVPPGKIFVEEYSKFIAHKNEKLGSAGKLPEVRQALQKTKAAE